MMAPRLLTVREAADRLGVSHDSVQRLITAGAIAAVDVRVSGPRAKLRVTEDELARFIADRAVPAVPAATRPRAVRPRKATG